MIDEIGAHVSSAGGVCNAPGRAAERNSNAFQMFTKMASRWAEPECSLETGRLFRAECDKYDIRFTAAHDSYLINLATRDELLLQRSRMSFISELERCTVLKLDALVSHPGNATGGDREYALAQNADEVAAALAGNRGDTIVLFETTAGAGTALGASFRELAELIRRVGPELSSRVGICVDTCHIWAAGYDIAEHYDDVFAELGDTVGFDRIKLFHLNDSIGGLGSRRDRHAHLGTGSIGPGTFERLMNDERFYHVPKVIETPKDDDVLGTDRMNLTFLRNSRANRFKSA